eukprot:m.123213 g.123213  ORF g.123213 m.123213 type:complete len:309 (+) comp37816_c0_seq1:179-1105(+)
MLTSVSNCCFPTVYLNNDLIIKFYLINQLPIFADASFERSGAIPLWSDKNGNGLWKIQSSAALASPLSPWHPFQDHTYKSTHGHYAIASSKTTEESQLSAIAPGGNICGLRLWAFAEMPTALNVVTSKNASSLEISGQKKWESLEVSLRRVAKSERVDLEVFLNSTFVALDDIEFTGCPDFTVCSFERDSCGWVDASTHFQTTGKWTRRPAFRVGPPLVDKTKNSPDGCYMKTNISKLGQKAALIGLPLPIFESLSSQQACGIQFWFYIHRGRNSSLSVVIWSGPRSQTIWNSPGDLDSWILAQRIYN